MLINEEKQNWPLAFSSMVQESCYCILSVLGQFTDCFGWMEVVNQCNLLTITSPDTN